MTVTGAVAGITAASADTQTPPVGAVSAAHGHGLFLNAVGLNLLGTASAHSAFDAPTTGWAESQTSQLQASLLGLNLSLGTVSLPLLKDPNNPNSIGLLSLGDLDALVGTAASPAETESTATSGIVGAGGNAVLLNPDDVDPAFKNAQLDASALISQVLSPGVAAALLDTAHVEIGALGAKAEKLNGTITDQYMVAELEAEVRSKLLADLTGVLQGTVTDLVAPITALAGPGGALEETLKDLVDLVDALPLVTASIGDASIDLGGLVAAINTELLTDPIQNADQSISIDLNNGMVTINLAALVLEQHPTAATLSELDPNTEVLSDEVVLAILSGVSDALIGSGTNSVVSKVVNVVTDGIFAAQVSLDLSVGLGVDLPVFGQVNVADGPIVIAGTLGGFLGQSGHITPVVDVSGVALLSGLPCLPVVGCLSALVDLGALLQPVVNLITPLIADIGSLVLAPVVDTVVPGLQQGLVDAVTPLLTDLFDNALEPVLNELLKITINEQPTEPPAPISEGDLGTGSFTVRALSVTVLPLLNNAVKLDLASATVIAETPSATLTATPAQVAEGEDVALTGEFFAPNETVTFQVNGSADATIIATTDADGNFSTTWTVPDGFDLGTVTFMATDVSGNTSSAAVEVVAATLSASDAQQGGTVNVAGTNFVPGETVTINLPGGGSATVTAAPDGSISYSWSVPQTQAPGTVTFIATGTSGRTATADAEITLAVATLIASPNPVQPDDTVTLVGGNFVPNENVILTLPIGCTVASGTPVVANASGSFTATCVASTTLVDGSTLNFSAEGVGSGRSATAQTLVQANIPADANTNASASAAASAQADGNNQAVAQAAAQVAAMADNSSTARAEADVTANAAAEAAARTSVDAGASVAASATATTATNASAQAAAQANATSTSSANANASANASVAGSVDARAASQASADAAASSTSSANASQNATANVRADANASASASASAAADGNQRAAAQAAAEAAAYSANDSDASAAANPNAIAAADAAAYADVEADASATASADATTMANSAAQASARSTSDTASTATAQATASADQNADSDSMSNASADYDSASAARAAAQNSATADANGGAGASGQASQDAAANVNANANASASASASADADNYSNASAQVAAQAAAFSNNDSDASAAADIDASAAAQAAARPNVDAEATANASEDAGSSAIASATSTADTAAAQDANSTAAANVNAEASSMAAAQATASTNASQNAAADVNASASAAASAQADSNANAAAEAAAETSAMADASATATADASAAATANAEAAAQAAAQIAARADVLADASKDASQDTSADANVAATAAAQASANHDATAQAAASAQATANATANAASASEAAANQAANADSSATASATASAAANVDAKANAAASSKAAASAAADASGGDKLAKTGVMLGGISAAGLLLLFGGAVTAVIASRRTRAAQN